MNLKKSLTKLVKVPSKEMYSSRKLRISEEGELISPDNHVANGKNKWKLNGIQRIYLCRMLAEGFSINEIRYEMLLKFNVELHRHSIIWYRNHSPWKEQIKKFRDKFLADMDDVPTFHKKVRMLRHERAYDMAVEQHDPRVMNSSTEHSRLEVEGGGSNLTLISNRFYNMSDEELLQREQELLTEMKNEKGAKNGLRGIEVEVGKPGESNGVKDVQ